PDADYQAIKAAYRKAVKAYHPDLHIGDAAAEHLSRRIIAAHTVLKDAERRTRYDEYLRRRQKGFRLTVMTGLASAVVVAGGSLALLSVLLKPDARHVTPAFDPPAATTVKADRLQQEAAETDTRPVPKAISAPVAEDAAPKAGEPPAMPETAVQAAA